MSMLSEQVKPKRADERSAVTCCADAPVVAVLRDRARNAAWRSRVWTKFSSSRAVSKTVMPMRVPHSQVFSQSIGVFATDSFADQAVLSSSLHQMWAIKYGCRDARTIPAIRHPDVFETFPRPAPTDRLAEIGRTLDTERREIMLRRELGLTKLYNLVNDPDYTDDDIERMRQIHVELDQAVMDAYGWGDVPLDHGFHTYRQMRRWTVSPAARVEILDRLLEENLRRAAAQGEAPPPADDEDEGDDE